MKYNIKHDQITPNFKLSEFLKNEPFYPETEIIYNLVNLAHRMQVVRDLFNKPIKITSGYRNPERNKKVGGSKNSYHVKGMAADFVVIGVEPKEVQKVLKDWSGGMGCYKTFTHLDIREEKDRWS